MKKLLFILSILLSGCSCLLSQIPPQKIYAGAGCSAILPDYRLKIIASDNCEIASFTQVPAPGFVLNATLKTTTVTVKATDASGNFRQVMFTVTLLDTIKPVLTIDTVLLAYSVEQANEFYDFGDKLIANHFDNVMIQSWIDDYPGLREKLADSAFYKQTLVVLSNYKAGGERTRFISFADSVTLNYRRK
jgi:uncharacterized protein YceK